MDIATTKNLIHGKLSEILAEYYFSFLEVTENSGARYALAFRIIKVETTSANPSALPVEEKFFTRFKITFTNNTLTLVQASDISVNKTVSVPLFQYDASGNIIPVTDADGQPIESPIAIASAGVAETAEEARNAENFNGSFATYGLILAK